MTQVDILLYQIKIQNISFVLSRILRYRKASRFGENRKDFQKLAN